MASVVRNRFSSKRDQGAAMVEFALVLPILLMLVFGIIDFSLYFYNDLELSHAARDAARRASVATSPSAYAAATAIVQSAHLVPTENTTNTSPAISVSTTGGVTTVTAVGSGTYRFFSPFLPFTLRLGPATAVMRHE